MESVPTSILAPMLLNPKRWSRRRAFYRSPNPHGPSSIPPTRPESRQHLDQPAVVHPVFYVVAREKTSFVTDLAVREAYHLPDLCPVSESTFDDCNYSSSQQESTARLPSPTPARISPKCVRSGRTMCFSKPRIRPFSDLTLRVLGRKTPYERCEGGMQTTEFMPARRQSNCAPTMPRTLEQKRAEKARRGSVPRRRQMEHILAKVIEHKTREQIRFLARKYDHAASGEMMSATNTAKTLRGEFAALRRCGRSIVDRLEIEEFNGETKGKAKSSARISILLRNSEHPSFKVFY